MFTPPQKANTSLDDDLANNPVDNSVDNPVDDPVDDPVDNSMLQTARLPTWKIQLLYDGACPLCVREVNFLQKRDAGRELVSFIDIADLHYQPEAHGGIDFETAMGRIHAVLPDGTVVKNVEVFRRTYEILGMGWIYAATKLPIIGKLADAAYGLWADWRLTLTGRPELATIVAERQKRTICKPICEPICEPSGRCHRPESPFSPTDDA